MELFDRLLDIERKLWTNDAPVYRDTLLHDAILIFPETDVITTDAAVEAIRQERAAAISGCLADDVEWEIPGAVRLRGKAAFGKEIENEAFVGRPEIDVARLTEQNDVVIVFEMAGGRIRSLISYLVEIP